MTDPYYLPAKARAVPFKRLDRKLRRRNIHDCSVAGARLSSALRRLTKAARFAPGDRVCLAKEWSSEGIVTGVLEGRVHVAVTDGRWAAADAGCVLSVDPGELRMRAA